MPLFFAFFSAGNAWLFYADHHPAHLAGAVFSGLMAIITAVKS